MNPVIRIFRGFNPAWDRMHCASPRGDCLDLPREDLIWFDLDQKPEVGDLVLAQAGNSPAVIKYLLRYNGRLVLASKHPPIAVGPRIRILGPRVLQYSPGCTREVMPESEVRECAREMATARAQGYGSPAYIMSVLGLGPSRQRVRMNAATEYADAPTRGTRSSNDVR